MAEFVARVGEHMPEVEAFVYENNSTDETAAALMAAATKEPRLRVWSETWDLEAFRDSSPARTVANGPCRIALIAEARNRLLDWIRECRPHVDDRIVLVDWDFQTPPSVNALCRWLLDLPDSMDAVFANGVGPDGRYYDLYEIRTDDFPFGPEIVGDFFWHDRQRERRLGGVIPVDSDPIRVFSAFGGLGIYRPDALDAARYSAYPTQALHDFYLPLLTGPGVPKKRQSRRGRRLGTHYEGVAIGQFLFGEEVFYRNNSGYNYPVAAEHVNLHMEMRSKGRGRFFIAPDLVYFKGPMG